MKIVTTSKFRSDFKRCIKRGMDMQKLKEVLSFIAEGKSLDVKYRDHSLSGKYIGHRECHIQPDWLLIYKVSEDKMILTATRTGTHDDLFKK